MAKKKRNVFELDFASQVDRYRLPTAQRNYRFCVDDLGRRWELDFAWPEFKLGVELQGVVSAQCRGRTVDIGGHGTVAGRVRDMNKFNAGILIGWAVLQFCQDHVDGVAAIAMTQRALIARGWGGRL